MACSFHRRLALSGLLMWLLSAAAIAQSDAGAIDDCGQLVQGATCVLVEVAGGRYALAEYYGYRVGDLVRVVGEVDPSCNTICADADGCIRGAVLYDPAQYPCGTPLPNFPADICTGAASGLALAALAVMRFAPRSARRRGAPEGRISE